MAQFGAADSRVIVESLKLTKGDASTWTYEIASNSRSTETKVREVLSRILEKEVGERVQLGPEERLKIAFHVAKFGALSEATRALDWREFEKFTESCLRHSGFRTERNIRLNDGKNRWEIDVIARKDPMLLCFDCKHWVHSSPQKLRSALEHQTKATRSLVLSKQNQLDSQPSWALPIVLTLFDTDQSSTREGVLVSIARLQDFLEHLTPFDPEIPFIRSEQKPIR